MGGSADDDLDLGLSSIDLDAEDALSIDAATNTTIDATIDSTISAPIDLTGRNLNGLQVLRKLGQGGMGEV